MKPLTKPTYPALQAVLACNQVRNALERIGRTTIHNNGPDELQAIAANALDNLNHVMVVINATLAEQVEAANTITTGPKISIVAFSNEERN